MPRSLEPVKVGVVGCGNISGPYLKISKSFPILEMVAVADVVPERARAAAEEHDVPAACTTDELLACDDVEVVLNLTPPAAHAAVNVAALKAGKHLYSEKPLATNRQDGKAILDAAEAAGVRVGCAPDTWMGAAHQTARKLIDDGAIGRPVAATAFMLGRGPEGWHPDPEFFYKPGGGPLFDMGPYYLSDLTMLLGPIRRATAAAGILINPRVIGSQAKRGQEIEVETPDHIAGTFEFAAGAIGTLITSFAVCGTELPRIEVYGTDGTLSVPDPNCFNGQVRLLALGSKEWREMPYTHGYTERNHRSLGLADMATAIRTGRPHRVTGEQAYHVLDVMEGFLDASQSGRHYEVASTFERPAPLPVGLTEGELDG